MNAPDDYQAFGWDDFMKTYDLVIIGSGTAAQAASSRVRAAGWSVALVDHRPFGGTCALRGCDPKRVLISGAEAIDAEVHMRGHGVKGEARIDWRDLLTFKRSFTDMCRVTSKGILPKMALTPFTELPASLVEMSLSLRARSLWLDTFWSLLVRARYRWIFPAKSMLSPANN